jgi:hypothetical protein
VLIEVEWEFAHRHPGFNLKGMTMTMTNELALARLCADYATRAEAFGLKPGTQKFIRDQEAYMDGGTSALVMGGLMAPEVRGFVVLMAATGRLPALVLEKAKLAAIAKATGGV